VAAGLLRACYTSSLNESLDLITPSGKALAGMSAVFAEFERSILKE
jgi:DNA invertase Pin-like site-specific DNA recombinase